MVRMLCVCPLPDNAADMQTVHACTLEIPPLPANPTKWVTLCAYNASISLSRRRTATRSLALLR